MKKLAFYRNGLFLTLGLILISNCGNSQEVQLDKRELKEVRRAEMLANFRALDSLIERKKFVIAADILENRYGDRVNVNPVLNFIKVDSSEAVLQTGSDIGLGYNGVGGITAEGSIRGWKIVKNLKNLNYMLRFSVSTNIGFYDIDIMLSPDRNARATISGLTPGDLIYNGHIEAIGRSGIYKGQNIF